MGIINDKTTFLKALLIAVGSIIVIFLSIYNHTDIWFAIALTVWYVCFVTCLTNLKDNIVMFCFLGAFFVFLLGREVCFNFLGLKRYYNYLEPYNRITFILITVSLISLEIGYVLSSTHSTLVFDELAKRNVSDTIIHSSVQYQEICKFFYYICFFFSLLSTIAQIMLVRSIGYVESYVADSGSTSLPGIFNYISSFMNVALSLYLATYPPKKDARTSLIFYEVYAILTLATGHRYTFVAISMYVIIYFFIRQRLDGDWINKKNIVLIVVAMPIIITLLTAMDFLRTGKSFRFTSANSTLISFLDQQGGSVNVIKRIFYYRDKLKDMAFTSFTNIRSIIFENIISRHLFGTVVYTGNSIENALNGHSLAHRLSYYEYGYLYLQGHGVGTCYIAELFHDFDIIGVIIGNIFYGILIRKISELKLNHFMKDGIYLSFITGIMLAPRGDFDGFLSSTFSLYSILGVVIIWFLTKEMQQ